MIDTDVCSDQMSLPACKKRKSGTEFDFRQLGSLLFPLKEFCGMLSVK